jgi:hypothetical protein
MEEANDLWDWEESVEEGTGSFLTDFFPLEGSKMVVENLFKFWKNRKGRQRNEKKSVENEQGERRDKPKEKEQFEWSRKGESRGEGEGKSGRREEASCGAAKERHVD